MGIMAMTIGPNCQQLGCSLDDLQGFVLAEFDWTEIAAVVCGIEPGWDHAMALTAFDLNVPVFVTVPYLGWEKKWSASIQKKCEHILNNATILASMMSDHTETPADHDLAASSDTAVALIPPGWSNGRLSVATLRKLPVKNVWPSWLEAGIV